MTSFPVGIPCGGAVSPTAPLETGSEAVIKGVDGSKRYGKPNRINEMSKPPPVEFQPGMEVVPGYTLLSPLGSGMAGDVWQAQAAGGIRVALKVVRSLSDVGGRKELKALKTIRDVHHPNLCPLFGFWTKDADGRVLADGETEELTLDSSHLSQLPPGLSPKMSDSGGIGETMAVGPLDDTGSIEESQPAADLPTKSKVRAEQLIVVMGLGDCTLYDRLKYVRREAGIPHDDFKTPCGLDATETIRYLRSSASAIDLLNLEHDVYHFDIKPQNILLVGGEAQVCDFGLAKKIEADMRETQQTMATPAYASPEILEGKQLSRAEGETLYVDQYSLAVTYYELRTGLLPFDVTTHASMLVAKSTGKLDLEAIPPAERKVIQRAMRKKPKDRYGSCSEFINALAVAAGVDKAGGITTGRLLIAGAILLLGTGMGMAGWRYAAPDHFNSFFQLDKSAADLLAARRDDFQKLDSESFGESVRTLSTIAEDAASIAESSTDAIKSDALALYRDSIDRLLESTHQALEASESAGNIPEEKLPRFRNVVALLDIDSESPTESQQAVLLGQKQLSESSEQDRAASRRHRVLHDAARVRFNMLAKRATPSDVLDRIRDACEDGVEGTREQLGDSRLSPETLAVLPLLGSSSDDATELSFRQWLESQRLEDVLRAEAFQSLAGKPGPLASRWMSKRQAFLLAISPAVSGDRRDEVDDAVLGRLLGAFPDLLAESRLADLRSAVQDAKWENASDLLFQLESGNPSEDVRLQVGLLSEMVSNRQRENAVQLLRRYWESNRLDRETSERVRLSEPVTSYLNFIATRTIEQSPDVFSSLHLQIDDALWLSDRASMDLPDGYLEATLVSFLRLLGSDASKAIASPGDWDKFRRVADEIRDQARSEAYRVAVDLEQQMFNEKRLPADVR
ncbi:MAG: protein kinase, partial [Planctomycetota bacterium]